MRTSGQTLPDTFVAQDFSGLPRQWQLPHCLTATRPCDALIVDLDGDGIAEVVLFSAPTGVATAFRLVGSTWTVLGTLANTGCPGMREALKAGQAQAAPAALKEIEAAGNRMWVVGGCK